jgi:hemerythrin-like domain-containing protein
MVKLEQLTSAGVAKKKETFNDPIRHLQACHERIEDRLQTLERVAERFTEKPEEAADALRSCFHFFDTNGAWHTEDEEQSVFPRLRPILSAEEENGLQRLEAEHQNADRLYAALKQSALHLKPLELPLFRERVGEFCSHYRTHIRFEEPLLDSIAAKLNPADLEEIAAEMKRRRSLF